MKKLKYFLFIVLFLALCGPAYAMDIRNGVEVWLEAYLLDANIDDPDIDGGTYDGGVINNSTIGLTTPLAGAFTELSGTTFTFQDPSGTTTHTISNVQEDGLGGRLTIAVDETTNLLVLCQFSDAKADFALAKQAKATLVIMDSDYNDYMLIQQSSNASTITASTAGAYLQLNGYEGVRLNISRDLDEGDPFIINSGSGDGLTDTNGEQSYLYIEPTPEQSGTAAFNGVKIDLSGTTTFGDGTTGDGNNLLWAGVSGVSKFRVDITGIVLGVGTYGHDMNGETIRAMQINDQGEMGYDSSSIGGQTNVTLMEDTSWIFDLRPVNYEPRKKEKVLEEKEWVDRENVLSEDGNVIMTLKTPRKEKVIVGEKYGKESTGKKRYGLIAEEVEQVNPAMVFHDKLADGSKEVVGVHYQRLIAPMLNEMKKMKAQIEALEKRIEALENK